MISSVNGTEASFIPYHTHGGIDMVLYVSETLVGSARVHSSSTLLFDQQILDILSGDNIYVEGRIAGYSAHLQLYSQGLLINGSTIVTADPLPDELARVAVYRQANSLVPSDALSEDLKSVFTQLPAVGTVEVQRFGPSEGNRYSWTVSFVSLESTNLCDGTCFKVSPRTSAAIHVSCDDNDLSGFYVSDKFYSGRRYYERLESPYVLYYDGSKWNVADRHGVLAVSSIETLAVVPFANIWPTCLVQRTASAHQILNGNVTQRLIRDGSGPSLDNVVQSMDLVSYTHEVQRVSIKCVEGLPSGYFSLDFNDSNVAVLFRSEEESWDFKSKFESIPTVGDIEVVRGTIFNSVDEHVGYFWDITFLTNLGDLPLISIDVNIDDRTPQYSWLRRGLSNSDQWYALNIPAFGATLFGNGLDVQVEEIVKGSLRSTTQLLDNLQPGRSYSVNIIPHNRAGNGISSRTVQNTGRGIIPLSFFAEGHPEMPNISSVSPLSASQLNILVHPAAFSGGTEISKVLLEYTSDPDFDEISIKTFSIFNLGPYNDVNGYWQLFFEGFSTGPLPFDTTAAQMQDVINRFPPFTNISVTRELRDIPGGGYVYQITISNLIGSASRGRFSADLSTLSSESLTHDILFENGNDTIASIPENYGAVWMTSDCQRIRIGGKSPHQVLTIKYSILQDSPGLGTFVLTFGSLEINCIPYNITAFELQDILSNLPNGTTSGVFVEERIRDDGFWRYRELHIFFEGFTSSLEWSLLRIPPEYEGNTWSHFNPGSCVEKEYVTTEVSLLSVQENIACFEGLSAIQTIVLDSSSLPAGTFRLFILGKVSIPLSVDIEAEELAETINSLLDTTGITVSKHFLGEGRRNQVSSFRNYTRSWVVTFPSRMGDVESIIVDDRHVTGLKAGMGVYPMVNISIQAQKSDIGGHFRIVLGSESTIPLAWDASDATVLNALHNLTGVGKVTMLGYGHNLQPSYAAYSVNLASNSTTLVLFANATGRVTVGDPIVFESCPDTHAGRYIEAVEIISDTESILHLSESTFNCSGEDVAKFRVMATSRTSLPGLVSIIHPTNKALSCTTGAFIIETMESLPRSFSLLGKQYEVNSTWTCGENFCSSLMTPYQGPSIESDQNIYIFNTTVQLFATESWRDQFSGDYTIWIGEYSYLVTEVNGDFFISNPRGPIMGETAYRTAYGYERCLVFKVTTADVSTLQVVLESDWHGTDVQVYVRHSHGLLPGQFSLGSLSEVQTIAFRSTSYQASQAATLSTFQLVFGGQHSQETILFYGSSALEWEHALQSLPNIDRVTVTRNGDGSSAPYSYGYIYTIMYWGEYGSNGGIPQLLIQNSTLDDVEIVVDTIREGETPAYFSSRYLALDDSTNYTLRIRTFNSKYISTPSALVHRGTHHIGGLPGKAQSFLLGRYKSGSRLSLEYLKPQLSGGLITTGYFVEWDTTEVLHPSHVNYGSKFVSVTPEIQQLMTSFHANDDVKTRGGYFTLTWGGRTTPLLAFDISDYNLEIALNILIGTRDVAVPPVTVSRSSFNRGYLWLITFHGVHGDVGLLQVDYSLLAGDDPRMEVKEIQKGFGDIVPGSYTYEVQTVRTSALSRLQGYFKLTMEGYETDIIAHNESALSLQRKLESLRSIYTLKVKRETISSRFDLYAWKITFTHMRNEITQGAGNLPPLIVSSIDMTPRSSAQVLVFEDIKGTSPFSISLEGLIAGEQYFAHVTPYNNRGFSLETAVSTSVALGQPSGPDKVDVSITSGTELLVEWAAPPSFYNIDGYLIEWYASSPQQEVQVITTSSSEALSEIQRLTIDSDEENLAGYFKLEFMGETTIDLPWNANAVGDNSVAQALAQLSSVGEIDVTRSQSQRVVLGLRVNVTMGSTTATVSLGSTSSLKRGDLIWIANLPFYISSVDSTTIYLGNAGLSPQTFDEMDVNDAKVYKWSYGYFWDITFSSQIGDLPTILPLVSNGWGGTNPIIKIDTLREGVAPLSGLFRVGFLGEMTSLLEYDISAQQMEAALEELTTIADVSVTRFVNRYGYDWRITFLSELYDVPDLYVDDTLLAGPKARATISTAQNGQVPQGYLSQFVSSASTPGSRRLASTDPSTLSFGIKNLQIGTPYQVRILAHNDLGYSAPTIGSPEFVSPKTNPDAPFNSTILTISPTQLKVIWYAPPKDGGAPISSYKVEWDLTSDFKNVELSKNYAVIPVKSDDGPSFCFDISITLASSSIQRYARIFAYNDYKWSQPSLPSPRSANGKLQPPGAPVLVQARTFTGVGILVSWKPPSSDACAYGGDGGSPLAYFVVEYDTVDNFSSPPKTIQVPATKGSSNYMYVIGGRDPLTGKEQSLLTRGETYYIRVIAFNGVGAGSPGYALANYPDWQDDVGHVCDDIRTPMDCTNPQFSTLGPKSFGLTVTEACCICKSICGVLTRDGLPDSPRNVSLRVKNSTTLVASWDSPLSDGGASLEKYRLKFSPDSSFKYYEVVDLPIVSEVQTVVAESEVVMEVQAIRMTTEVTNERQVFRTSVVGKDEIQSVTTHCDDVINEVQRVTTTASDVNEIQSIELVGTDVDEVQLVRTNTVDLPEIQVVSVFTPEISEVQRVGVILGGVNTSGCAVGATCPNVEAQVTGTFKLQFYPEYCGTDVSNVDTNWCIKELERNSITSYHCTTSTCMTTSIALTEAASSVETKLCSLNAGGPSFMTDGNGKCVDVTKIAEVLDNGVYALGFEILFEGDYLRGNVPSLLIPETSIAYATSASFLRQYTYTGGVMNLGDVTSVTGTSFTVTEGNQPTGVFVLSYECECSTTPFFANISGSGTLVDVGFDITDSLYQFVRLGNTYHQVVGIDTSISSRGVISPRYVFDLDLNVDAEIGVFYSDPSTFDGVSDACRNQRINPTSDIAYSASETILTAILQDLSDVLDDRSDSIEISREDLSPGSGYIGYIWSITFHRQNGDLNEMTCGSSNLGSWNQDSVVFCNVSTIRDGSLLGGSFELGMMYPHHYISTPSLVNSSPIPWYVDASHLSEILSSSVAFGDVSVERSVYIPSSYKRWVGGYLWSIKFISLGGNLSSLVPLSFLQANNASYSCTIEIGTETHPLSGPVIYHAIDGNQISGYFGLNWNNGTLSISSAADAFPVVSSTTNEALSADEFDDIIESLFGFVDLFKVSRSSTPNQVLGYTYYVEFTGKSVGGDVPQISPTYSQLTSTATANGTLDVGEICTDSRICTLGDWGVFAGVVTQEYRQGAELRGAFQLVFGGHTTGAIPYDASAQEVQKHLNSLDSISPSQVIVTRDGPISTPDTQVLGYIWSITFASNVWVDPTITHTSERVPGNWVGKGVTTNAVWPSGYSKAWGKNVGNQDMISCTATSLYSTQGSLPDNSCQVEEIVAGTAPLHGTFSLALNTTNHLVINRQEFAISLPIRHNAPATATDSGGDGSSVEEILEKMPNIGDVSVSRSEVNVKNGGYTWTITFLRDKDMPGGQWNGQCEQKDSLYGLCNSPGDVPKLAYVETNLGGECRSNPNTDYTCTRITVIDGDNDPTDAPPGSREVQAVYISDLTYNNNMTRESFALHYTSETTDCIPVFASGETIAKYIMDNITAFANSRGFYITTSTDLVSAPNGVIITLYYLDDGDFPDPDTPTGFSLSNCHVGSIDNVNWTSTFVTLRNGNYGITKAAIGAQKGVVQRGNLTLYIPGESITPSLYFLPWNAPPEGSNSYTDHSVKWYLESTTNHIVNVTQQILGKYGVAEYEIRFVRNPGNTPPGSGDVPLLVVEQNFATDGVKYPISIYELVKGSTGIGGQFKVNLHSPTGSRIISSEETPSRMKRKLEEMTTVGKVFVSRSAYPSASSGGWGDVWVDDDTRGGYEWQIFFLRNPGTDDGFSFPPGSGNVDPITVTYSPDQLLGTNSLVESLVYADGSTPIDGTFSLSFMNLSTSPIRYDQPLQAKSMLESLNSIGKVSLSGGYRLMSQIEGVYVRADQDSDVLYLEYNSTKAVCGDIDQCPPDIRQFISPGDLFRIGGVGLGSTVDSFQAIDGGEYFAHFGVESGSPLLVPSSTLSRPLYPDELLRLGGKNYQISKTGIEIHVVSISCPNATSACGNFLLNWEFNGVVQSTDCLYRSSSVDMTSASQLSSFFDNLDFINEGDVYVTRRTIGGGEGYVFSIYYLGSAVAGGDILPLIVSNCPYKDILGNVSTFTAVEGGFTETQRIRMNVDAGYVISDFFQVKYHSETTDCLEWGADADVVQAALNNFGSFNRQLLPFTGIHLDGNTITTSSSIYGIVDVDDVIILSDDSEYRIDSIISSFQFSVAKTLTITSSSDIYRKREGSVLVSRYGTGNSTSTAIQLASSSDREVPQDAAGYYKLKLLFGGKEYITSTCINYHATAEELKSAIDSFNVDFNVDGGRNDLDHITVQREGDGSISSGYGYSYILTFSGPIFTFGRSESLGQSLPVLQVVDQGDSGRCPNAIDRELVVDSFMLNFTESPTRVVESTASTIGVLQVGDRIRLPNCTTPEKVYTVLATAMNGMQIHLDAEVSSSDNSTVFTVYKLDGPTPSFSVKTLLRGEDSYYYDVYFVGSHLSDVSQLEVSRCSTALQHLDGLRWSLSAETLMNGGSVETQVISFLSQEPIETSLGVARIVLQGPTTAVSPEMTWTQNASAIEQIINNLIATAYTLSPSQDYVSVRGFGTSSSEEGFGFSYIITFTGFSGQLSQLQVITSGKTSVPYLITNSHLDDLLVFGTYNGTSSYSIFDLIIYDIDDAGHEYLKWRSSTTGWSSLVNISSNSSIYLVDGISVVFPNAGGHELGATWTFTGVLTSGVLPETARISVTTNRSGFSDNIPITTKESYVGEADGIVPGYLTPLLYRVQNQEVEIFKLTTINPVPYSHDELGYSFVVNGVHSTCLDWDASDSEIELIFANFSLGLCGESNSDCVTVTRGVDILTNPLGYVYTIYLDGASVIGNIDDNIIEIDYSSRCMPTSYYFGDLIKLEHVSDGSDYTPLTRGVIPLARVGDAFTPATFKGASTDGAPIYKVNGNYWAVTFETNLGDLPALGISSTKYLSEGTSLKVYDNVVRGVLPSEYELSNLLTGIEYGVRVESYTRGPFHGYSLDPSNTSQAFAIPYTTPDYDQKFAAYPVLFVDEVQEIVVSASKKHEIQTISTTAATIAEVQMFTLSVPDTQVLQGAFSLRFPELQIIELSSGSPVVAGSFALNYTYYDDSFHLQSEVSECIAFDSSAAQIESVLEKLINIDNVEVTRSSAAGGYSSTFGYTWIVAFVGNKVAGNVLPLTFDLCVPFSSTSNDTILSISTKNENRALGTDTEIQSISIEADTTIVQGQFQLSFSFLGRTQTTNCLDWNTTASTLENELKSLGNIDYVYVERDDGKMTGGYRWTVYYTGNRLHNRLADNDPSTLPGLLELSLGDGVQCTQFSHIYNGILTDFDDPSSLRSLVSNVTRFNRAGFDLDSVTTTGTILKERFNLLPSFSSVDEIRANYDSETSTNQWSLLFSESSGDVPALTCGINNVLNSQRAICEQETLVNGNVIRGYFTINGTKLLPADVSSSEMEVALEKLPGVGDVQVTRSGPNIQLGYIWTITWMSAIGPISPLRVVSSLVGSNVSVVVRTLQDSNWLSGNYTLKFGTIISPPIPYDASASVLKNSLESNPFVGLLDVTRQSIQSEGGSSYLVTFRGTHGDVPSLIPNIANLGGSGATVQALEKVKGSNALGNALKLSIDSLLHCSFSEVKTPFCGAPVDFYEVQVGSTRFVEQTLTVPANYQIQKVRVAAESLFSNSVPHLRHVATGLFSLVYNGVATEPLSAQASSVDLREALEALPDITTVMVSRSRSASVMDSTVIAVPGSTELRCALDFCDFSILPPGERIRVGGSWYSVSDTFAGSTFLLPLSLENDSSIVAAYEGTYSAKQSVYRYARGYEWTITFLRVKTSKILPLEGLKHDMEPLDATISIRPDDCKNCTYITGLTTWKDYSIRLRPHNLAGYGGFTPYIVSRPEEIPGYPTSLILEVLSGTQIKAYFMPPANADQQSISRYTVQWDTSPNFSNASSSSASCLTDGYGSCDVADAALAVTPPYGYIINYLTPSVKYFVRVAARNSIPVQQIDPSGTIPDNTKWSEVASAIPYNQAPSPLVEITTIISGKHNIQLLLTPPISDGGASIELLTIEWDISKTFSTASYGNVTVDYDVIPLLYPSGPLVYEIDNLTPGYSYWIRISAINQYGISAPLTTASSVTPAGKADQPEAVSLSHAIVQDTLITNVTVSWEAATAEFSDGGSPITGYLVEWWERRSIPEIQQLSFTSDIYPPLVGTMILTFGPAPTSGGSTAALPYNVQPANLRGHLINIGFLDGPENNFVIGNVAVSRQEISGQGYSWLVTFESSMNEGDQVPLFGVPIAGSGEYVTITEVQSGSRLGGFSEIQVLKLFSDGRNDLNDLGGYFRLKYNNTAIYTHYLPHDCDSDVMKRALEQLFPMRAVHIVRSNISSSEDSASYAGYEWRITFEGNIGNQPGLIIDRTYLTSKAAGVVVELYDGNNAIDTHGYKTSTAFPGETPAGYNSQIVGADDRSYVIENLVPGVEYFVAVSAINKYGVSPVTIPEEISAIPPQQKPQPPTDVSLEVNYGYSNNLIVNYGAPLSDGGDAILKYRIELDNVIDFSTAVYTEIMCPTSNLHSIFRIESHGLVNDPIVSGTFRLQVAVNGSNYVTDYLPYDATATAEQELGFNTVFETFTVIVKSGTKHLLPSLNVNEILFPNDRIQLSVQRYPDEIYTVVAVNGTSNITLDKAVLLPTSGSSTLSNIEVSRYSGGRGTVKTSQIACISSNLCSLYRRQNSGSIQSKLEFLTDAIYHGVEVDRDELPDETNGYTWRVTFIDNSPPNPFDYILSIYDHDLTTLNGEAASIAVTQIVDGESYGDCLGPQVVPIDKPLVQGEYYYARVFAYNSIGYSLPQTSINKEKPMIRPSPPTSVLLTTISKCDIRVEFNPPDSDGGDQVSQYLIEYSTSSDFNNETTETITVTYLEGGAPFFKTIGDLLQGVPYYVRVSAMNSQGYSDPEYSVPRSISPYEASSAPTNVKLVVTSDTTLTVSFYEPELDGGDPISSYIVEWDTSPGFHGVVVAPHKGSVSLNSNEYNSYTIPLLTEGRSYYVRVLAVNSGGRSVPARPSNLFAKPALQIPGKPHNIQAVTGDLAGEIIVTWQRPVVPWHNIPCAGTNAAPMECPEPIRGGLPVSNGGSPITEYLIEYNESPDFKGHDSGQITSTSGSVTLSDLTPGRLYYIRVLARNDMGSGEFCSFTETYCLVVMNQIKAIAKH